MTPKPHRPLPPSLYERIRRLNAEYILLAQELSRASTVAAPLLGVSLEIAEVIERTPLANFHPLVNSTMLVAQMRFQDLQLWRRFANKSVDANQLLHAFLRTMPAEFVAQSMEEAPRSS